MAALTFVRNVLKFFKKIYSLLILVVSMAGFVPKHATILRTLTFFGSLAFVYYLNNYQPLNSYLAGSYFLVFEVFYIVFITITLLKNGIRLWFIKTWGEKKGYLMFEAILGFLFFHNGASIGYVASSSPDDLFDFIPEHILLPTVAILFIAGFVIKTWAAHAVTIEIYYWKDMFLGKKISEFIISGPYKYFKNPMYGMGQLQAYAVGLWYGSAYGLIAAFLNQALIFSFYYLVETEFINRLYKKTTLQAKVSAS